MKPNPYRLVDPESREPFQINDTSKFTMTLRTLLIIISAVVTIVTSASAWAYHQSMMGDRHSEQIEELKFQIHEVGASVHSDHEEIVKQREVLIRMDSKLDYLTAGRPGAAASK